MLSNEFEIEKHDRRTGGSVLTRLTLAAIAALLLLLAISAPASATIPTVTIDSGPPALSASVHATFDFSSADLDVIGAECRLDAPDEAGPDEGWAACTSPAEYHDLADGDHSFEVRVTNGTGEVSPVATHDWNITTVKPHAILDTGPSPNSDQQTAAFAFHSDNGSATFECRLDPAGDALPGEGWSACVTSVTYIDLTDGEHTFQVRAVDADAGSGPRAEVSWIVDTVTPTVDLTGAPAGISGTADPVFGFTSSETGTTAECRLDASDPADPWTACLSPVAYSGLADGDHTFEVRVTDAAGHVSGAAVYPWTVETTLPTATITSGPDAVTAEINAFFSFESTNDNASFECRLDPSPSTPWAACVNGVEFIDLADGDHDFEVRAVGQGAGPGPATIRSWTVDTVVPRLTIVSGPAHPTNETTAAFELGMNKPGFTFECRIDAEAPAPCTSPVTYPGLAAGDHSFVVEASNGNGDVVDSGLWNWKVLADPPVATVSDGPLPESSSGTATFDFSSDVPEATFECRVDAGTWATCTSPAGYSGLSDGPHEFEVRAGLSGSAPGTAAGRNWSIDTVAPTVTVTDGPGSSASSPDATFKVASDDSSSSLECRLDGQPWAACSGDTAFTGLSDGAHVLRVRAVDAVGNTGIARRDWSVDSTAPTTALDKKPDAETTRFKARFTFSADDPEATFECRLDHGEWQRCSSDYRATGLNRGGHQFAVRATDSLGNRGKTASHKWRVVAPEPEGIAPQVKFRHRVKLDSDGTARLATVDCPDGRCRVIAPKRTRLRVKGKRRHFSPGIKVPRGWYRERSVEIMVLTSPGTRRVVRNLGPVRIKVKLTVKSDNGKSRTVSRKVTLVVPKHHR